MHYSNFDEYLLAVSGEVETLELTDYEIPEQIAPEDKAEEAPKPKKATRKKKNDVSAD